MKGSNPNLSIEGDRSETTGVEKAAGISTGTTLSEGSVSESCPAQRMKKDENYKRVMRIASRFRRSQAGRLAVPARFGASLA